MIAHPFEFINKRDVETLIDRAAKAEALGQLHDDQLNLVYNRNWFKSYLPKSFGGLALSLPEVLRIEEGLSYADGSVGWVITLCSGAGWFIGFVDPNIAGEFFNNDRLCVAGSGAVTGTAELKDNGYELNGMWRYASGALHATAFTVNCSIRQNGQQLFNLDGSPKICSFILKKSEVNIIENWNSMGMIATASHSFQINKLLVPTNRCFIIDPAFATRSEPIFKYPFLQLAETTLAVNLSGMAVRFFDLCEPIFQGKVNPRRGGSLPVDTLAKTRIKLNELRKIFFKKTEQSWDELMSKSEISGNVLCEVTNASHQLADQSREFVNLLYPLCGLAAADLDTEINRVWRNFHTAAQHALFNR